MNRTVILVNPNRMKPIVSPVALDYLADALAESDWQVRLLDLALTEDWRSATENCLQSPNPAAICLTVRNLDDCFLPSRDFCIARVKDVIAHIRKITDAPVIIGGSGYSIAPERALEYLDADFGIVGDGELALTALVQALPQRGGLDKIPGLLWRDGHGTRRSSVPLASLDTLASSERKCVNNLRHFNEGGQVGIETKRGCPKACIYCADLHSKGSRIRIKSPDRVADEFQSLLNQGVTHFHLCDSEFNIPIDHALAVCAELISRGLNRHIRWYTYASPVPFPPELASLMKKSGCAGIDFGVDSAVPRILQNLRRDFGPDDLKRTAETCRSNGLTFMYDLLLGGPGETRETISHTTDFMERIAPSRVGLACGVRVYPKTELASRVNCMTPGERGKSLHGKTDGNEDFFEPVFYVSPELADDLIPFVKSLVRGNRMFFMPDETDPDADYNYNENTVLVDAIRRGYRGAYWDILRRLQEGEE